MAVFIQKGDAPLSVRQATKRGMQLFEQELFLAGARLGDAQILMTVANSGLPARLKAVVTALGVASYSDFAKAWEVDNEENGVNNLFNYQLAAYAAARARLARYRLAVGQEQVIETDLDTGAQTIVQQAIDPLPAQIEQPTIDEQTGEVTGTQMVANPAIVADDAERAAAQAVIDATPIEVVAFAG